MIPLTVTIPRQPHNAQTAPNALTPSPTHSPTSSSPKAGAWRPNIPPSVEAGESRPQPSLATMERPTARIPSSGWSVRSSQLDPETQFHIRPVGARTPSVHHVVSEERMVQPYPTLGGNNKRATSPDLTWPPNFPTSPTTTPPRSHSWPETQIMPSIPLVVRTHNYMPPTTPPGAETGNRGAPSEDTSQSFTGVADSRRFSPSPVNEGQRPLSPTSPLSATQIGSQAHRVHIPSTSPQEIESFRPNEVIDISFVKSLQLKLEEHKQREEQMKQYIMELEAGLRQTKEQLVQTQSEKIKMEQQVVDLVTLQQYIGNSPEDTLKRQLIASHEMVENAKREIATRDNLIRQLEADNKMMLADIHRLMAMHSEERAMSPPRARSTTPQRERWGASPTNREAVVPQYQPPPPVPPSNPLPDPKSPPMSTNNPTIHNERTPNDSKPPSRPFSHHQQFQPNDNYDNYHPTSEYTHGPQRPPPQHDPTLSRDPYYFPQDKEHNQEMRSVTPSRQNPTSSTPAPQPLQQLSPTRTRPSNTQLDATHINRSEISSLSSAYQPPERAMVDRPLPHLIHDQMASREEDLSEIESSCQGESIGELENEYFRDDQYGGYPRRQRFEPRYSHIPTSAFYPATYETREQRNMRRSGTYLGSPYS